VVDLKAVRTEASAKSKRERARAWSLVRELMAGGEMAERMRQISATYDLAPGPIKALQHLHRQGHLSMRDIARALGSDPSYVTALVDDLAEHGLVERQSHPGDRRIKTVVLTAKGIKVAEHVEQTFGTPPRSFDALSSAEAEQLARILGKVVDRPLSGDESS
jgi:DNA-binding MarR family transcriptional regulator